MIVSLCVQVFVFVVVDNIKKKNTEYLFSLDGLEFLLYCFILQTSIR